MELELFKEGAADEDKRFFIKKAYRFKQQQMISIDNADDELSSVYLEE